MKVASLVTAVFRTASAKDPILHETWIRISARIGGRLPNSLLTVNLQQCGELDLVLRAMEQEICDSEADLFSANYLTMLAGIWVGLTYEVVRLLKERKLVQRDHAFDELAHHLRLIRVPLEKHEIAADRKIVLDQLEMVRSPRNGDDSDAYFYKKRDPGRAHIMPMGLSDRGSTMWHVFDVEANQAYWLERRNLSERLVGLWGAA